MKRFRKSISRTRAAKQAASAPAILTDRLLTDVRGLIDAARQQVAQAVNERNNERQRPQRAGEHDRDRRFGSQVLYDRPYRR